MGSAISYQVGKAAEVEFPFQFREGLLWIEVKIAQSDNSLNFLVDTGASVSAIDLSVAKRIGIKLGQNVIVHGVESSLPGYWPQRLSAKAGEVQLPGEYLALDLSKLSGSCTRSVDGLLGADFFRNRVLQIDFKAEKLRVLSALPPDQVCNAIPLEVRRCGLRVPVNIDNHKRQWLRVDTGCAAALQWVTSDVPAGQCARKLAIGLSELSIPQTITTITLGNQRIEGVPTGLHRSAIFPGESGLLGNGLLARFGVITIDANSGRLILGVLPVQ